MRREHIVAGDDSAGGEQAVFGQPTAEFVRSADQLCRDIPSMSSVLAKSTRSAERLSDPGIAPPSPAINSLWTATPVTVDRGLRISRHRYNLFTGVEVRRSVSSPSRGEIEMYDYSQRWQRCVVSN
jgi:hypothetical protein